MSGHHDAPEALDGAVPDRAWARTVVVRLSPGLADRLYLIRDRLASAGEDRVTVSTVIRYALETAPLPD